jgi:importin-4
MAEVFRSISDALNLLGPGILGDDGVELAAITLLVLERDHPCQREDEDEEEPPVDDEDIAEIESVLLDAAVDVVIALARTLTAQFVPTFDRFYIRMMKSTVYVFLR